MGLGPSGHLYAEVCEHRTIKYTVTEARV
jgi:hypothetical protein